MDLPHLAISSVQKTLAFQREAVSIIAHQYETDEFSKNQLVQLLNTLYNTSIYHRGKIVLCGIGKSYKIAAKLVATLNSLAIQSSILHPLEALHGDLGMLREGDALIFVTASGNTPELLNLLPHISLNIPIVLLTCCRESKLSKSVQVKSILYAELPPHLKEDSIHGLPAPTVSATVTLALADATILALSELIEADLAKRKVSFSMNHPGGSIGASLSHLNVNMLKQQQSELPTEGTILTLLEHKENYRSSSSSLLSLSQIASSTSRGPNSYIPSSNAISISSPSSSDYDDDAPSKS